jgi:tRNA pseudouridine55 synthase
MYSAVKVNGVPLYKTAREGRTIDRALREVVIHTLDIDLIDGPDIFLRISCSKGTYIRSLCADIGAALGVGGHLRALERTKVGPLTVEHAISVEEFAAGRGSDLAALSWLSLDDALGALPVCRVSLESARKVLHGMALPYDSILAWEAMSQSEPDDAKPVRIKDPQGRLLAVGLLQHVDGGGEMRSHPSRQVAIKKVFISRDVATCVS